MGGGTRHPIGAAAGRMDIQAIATVRVQPNPWNPNTESEEVFNALVDTIREHGFDQPLVVVPDPAREGHYRIIKGEHRWRAARHLNLETVPCVVRRWDELEQRVQTVKDNRLRGELDRARLARLINELSERYQVPMGEAALRMAFFSEEELRKFLRLREGEALLAEELLAARRELQAIAGLAFILNTLFAQFGETVPQSYMFFTYGGKLHLMVMMHGRLKKVVDVLTQAAAAKQLDLADLLARCLEAPAVALEAGNGSIEQVERGGQGAQR